jgi:hypothetical protein
MGYSEMIGSLPHRNITSDNKISSLYGTRVPREIQCKDVALGNIPNVNDERKKLVEGTAHDAVYHGVSAEGIFRDGTRVGFCVRTKDEAREDCETYPIQNSKDVRGASILTRNNIKLRMFLHEFPEGSLC